MHLLLLNLSSHVRCGRTLNQAVFLLFSDVLNPVGQRTLNAKIVAPRIDTMAFADYRQYVT